MIKGHTEHQIISPDLLQNRDAVTWSLLPHIFTHSQGDFVTRDAGKLSFSGDIFIRGGGINPYALPAVSAEPNRCGSWEQEQ